MLTELRRDARSESDPHLAELLALLR